MITRTYFFVDLTRCRIGTRNSSACITFSYIHTPEESQLIEKAFRDAWAALKPKLPPHMSAKKKYQIIALEIAETVRYEWTGEAQTYSIAGPLLTRKGVCEGVCKLFLYHCIQAGLPARIIPASCDGTAHSLIQVWEHGKARYLDITVLQEQPAFYRLFPCAILVKKHTLRLFGIRPGDVCTPDVPEHGRHT